MRKYRVFAMTVGMCLLCMSFAGAQEANREGSRNLQCFAHTGAALTMYNPSATLKVAGNAVSGASLEVDKTVSTSVEAGMLIRRHIGLSVNVLNPVEIAFTGTGVFSNLGVLGQTHFTPFSFTGQYQIPELQRYHVVPYLGGGLSGAYKYQPKDGAVKGISFTDRYGAVLQGGANFPIRRWIGAYVDMKELFAGTTMRGSMPDVGNLPLSADIRFNMVIVSSGVSVRF